MENIFTLKVVGLIIWRKRKGREMREGKIPYPTYPAKKVGPNFDKDGKYIYPEGSGFNYMERLDPNSEWGGKVS